MIEIVIKIEEETYNRIMNGWMPLHKAVNLMENVQKGTPLPQGHGDLVDRDAIRHAYDCSDIEYTMVEALEDAPTIIEADKEEGEE